MTPNLEITVRHRGRPAAARCRAVSAYTAAGINGGIEGSTNALGMVDLAGPEPRDARIYLSVDLGGGVRKPLDDSDRLRLDGPQLRNARGEDVFLKGATAFMAYEAFLDERHDQLNGVLDELAAYGCNCVRVFGMAHYIPLHEYGRRSFAPQHYGDAYYERLPEFLSVLASRGMYVFWSTFPDNGIVMPDVDEQLRHHERLVPILEQAGIVLYELTNEFSAHDFNQVDVHRFSRPRGMLACSGGYTVDAPEYARGEMVQPVWDFGNIHPDRDYKKGVMDSLPYDNAYFRAGRGIVIGEPIRYGSNSSNPDLSPAHAQHAALAGRAGGMGWFFHSRNGVRLERFDDVTRPYAEAVFLRAYGAL